MKIKLLDEVIKRADEIIKLNLRIIQLEKEKREHKAYTIKLQISK